MKSHLKNYFVITLAFCLIAQQITCQQHSKDGWSGCYYQNHSIPQQTAAQTLLQQIPASTLKNAQKILDIGCASGAITHLIAQWAPHAHVIGVDKSQKMIVSAQQLHKKANLSFICSDAAELPRECNQYDLITCFSAFHWIERQHETIQVIADTLKSEGLLIIMMSTLRDPEDPWIQSYNYATQLPQWAEFASLNIQQEYYPQNKPFMENLLHNNSLIITHIEERKQKRIFSTKETFKDWVMGFIGGFHAFSSVSPEILEIFISDVITYYLSINPPDEDGLIIHYTPMLIIKATK